MHSYSESHSVVFNSLQLHGLYSPRNSPSQNTGVGSLLLLQRLFPTQGSKPGLLHCRQILYQLSHQWSMHSCKRTNNGVENRFLVIGDRSLATWSVSKLISSFFGKKCCINLYLKKKKKKLTKNRILKVKV